MDQRIAQAIVMRPDVTRPSDGGRIAVNDDFPDYAVVYKEFTDGWPPLIVTVVYRTYVKYVRDGAYAIVPAA